MAGKSNRGKHRKGLQQSAPNSAEQSVSSDTPVNDSSSDVHVNANGDMNLSESVETKSEVKEQDNASQEHLEKQADVHLYPVSVITQGGEKLELQLSPGDSVMDVRQFLLDAPETCFVTCYDLLLHTKDGSVHHLEDYNEISEVANITSGGCFLEMLAGYPLAALYDDRSIRAHVHRTRELLSLSTLRSSLSTMLALQHEIGRNASANLGDAVKGKVPEVAKLDFMENATSSLTNLFSSPSEEIKCVESIVFSSFNPPPSYRRLSGDLIYLDVVTLEGNKHCVTGTAKSFYVNSSTGNILDPRPNKAASEATTLVALLQKLSPKFKKAFRAILERKASAHPFENVQSLLPPNSWAGLYPVPDHKRDAARAENSLTISFGSELIGMQRDWNEELQGCREFPHTTHQERILRDRALYKVTSDFVEAATNGAIGVISRCIPPINPTDPECFHMYVHNNIFFSFAVDTDLEQLPHKLALEEFSKVKTTGTSQNPSDKKENNLPNGSSAPHTEEALSPDAEAQLSESEQATYASANNDLKGTKAYQEADVPGLYNLAMAIIDYRGHRVVAQSVLPGILQGDKSDSLLYGSVDNGKKICWSEDFHSKVLEAAKRLHLKEHSVLDGSGNVFTLAAPVECKGIVGSDDRHYLLDLMRATPRDANYTGSGSRFCILRPELITAFCHAKASEKLNSGCEYDGENPSDSLGPNNAEELVRVEENAAIATVDAQLEKVQECGSHSESKSTTKEILFNPNVFTEFKLAGNTEEIAADEENVRNASLYLKDVVLPKFIQDLGSLEVSPMDGQTLTEALHAHGINIRYIGRVAEETRHMPHLWDLCTNEIVVRSAKHIIKGTLRDTEDHDLGHAVSHLFNCLLGKIQAVSAKNVAKSTLSKNQKKVQDKLGNGGYGRKKQSLYSSITSESLWTDIKEFARLKYQFELPKDARDRVKKIGVIRNLCQKVGITIAARKYDFKAVATPFQVSDILNIQPLVKHSVPVCSEAKDLVETGKAQLAEGMLNEAYTLFSEAFTLLQQVTGPMHREVANCCRYLAMVLYHAGDMAGAIMQQHKELIINERYGNMALFYHGLNQTELALCHMSRALVLLSLSSGPDHHDVAATFINIAMMYQDIGKMDTALRYLQEALKKNERLLGEEHIQTAVCYHALAIAFNCMGAFKFSHQHEKKTYDILVKQLGEDDSRTKDSQNWMKTFKTRELQMNAQKQKQQALDSASAQKAIDVLKAHPDLIQAFQAAAAKAEGSGGSTNKSSNNGKTIPRGRGFDERAAKAAAEIRKKAAAKGLLTRPQTDPTDALQPLTQSLNIVNSGSTPVAVNETIDGVQGAKTTGDKEQAPVGLGSSLAALDAKKMKKKAKATS
uniref:Clustered mitochondria protein homolog n=1 Tax=Erythranthe lewisii TaxID=69919 RepID=A0A6M8DVY1_ERYLE|nr:tetratricopeptide repeat (TPR)-like superfamily protein 2 [Erythranthe lewisii]